MYRLLLQSDPLQQHLFQWHIRRNNTCRVFLRTGRHLAAGSRERTLRVKFAPREFLRESLHLGLDVKGHYQSPTGSYLCRAAEQIDYSDKSTVCIKKCTSKRHSSSVERAIMSSQEDRFITQLIIFCRIYRDGHGIYRQHIIYYRLIPMQKQCIVTVGITAVGYIVISIGIVIFRPIVERQCIQVTRQHFFLRVQVCRKGISYGLHLTTFNPKLAVNRFSNTWVILSVVSLNTTLHQYS
nr:MAG TPA: hypothetical protein [Caudoviricetes sp.]